MNQGKIPLKERKNALEGVRVIDFSWIVAGPQCTRILADFGADVIKIENESNMDYARHIIPGSGNSPNLSGMFNTLNRNKRSLMLNVMHPAGMEQLKELISISDVVIENFSSRVLERWGLGYEEQRKIRPDIIYCSMSGFGHSGRDRDYVTWGPTAQAIERRLKYNISSNFIKHNKGRFVVKKNTEKIIFFFNLIKKFYRLKSDA